MPTHRIANHFLRAVAIAVTRRPGWVIGAFLLLAAAGGLLTALRIELKTDQNDLVSADLPYNRRYLQFLEDFGDLEFIYVVIEVEGRPARAMRVVDAVAEEVSKLEEHVYGLFHRVPPEAFGDSALLLAPKEELERIASAVETNASLLGRFKEVSSFAGLFDLFAELLDTAAVERSPGLAEWGFRILDACLDSVAEAARGESPPPLESRFREAAGGEEDDPIRKGYLFSSNGELAFVEIMPRKNFETLEVIREPLARIREAIDRVRAKFPDVKMGLTGRPVLQADEMKVTNDDMRLSTVVALFLVVGLFIITFRRLRRPLLAAFSLMVAIALTFGLVTLTIGYLTLLSIVFTVMLVGLGMDFGVLFISRYQEELLATNDVEGSIRRTLLSAGTGIITGGLSTSFVFFSALFINFKGLAELGFVAGTGLLLCLITMLTFLPALILVMDRHIQRRRVLHPSHPVTFPLLARVARRPKTVLATLGALTLLGLLSYRGIPYNWNLLDLQAKGLESVDYELKILEKSERSTWYAAFILKGLEEIDRTIERLKPWQEKGVIGVVESVRDFVPADQPARTAILARAAVVLEAIELPAASRSVEPQGLSASLERLLDRLDQLQSLSAGRPEKEAREALRSLEGLITSVESIQDAIRADPGMAAGRLGPYQERWFRELRGVEEKVERMLRPPQIRPETIFPELRKRFVAKDGERYLIYAYPTRDIWIKEHMKEFVAAIQDADPNVTGTPIQVYESARLMEEGFKWAAIYSFLMVFTFLLIDFRSLRDACLTITPVIVGLFWAFELMPLFGLDFNLANFFSLPILIGCAVDGTVHMVHRFRQTGSTEDVGKATGTAVCLASLANMAGFAAMGLARHRGVASLGFVTALGCATILVAIVIFLPSLLQVLEGGRLRTESTPVREPGTEPDPARGAESLR